MGHGSENLSLQELNNEFRVPNGCSVTVNTKCGLYGYLIGDYLKKFIDADIKKLRHPYKSQSYKDKVFNDVTTFKPGVMCPNFSISNNYYPEKIDSDTGIITPSRITCCNYSYDRSYYPV
jgi:hypothetical protein